MDYEALPVVIDPEDAARDEVLLFPAMGTNTMAKMASKTESDSAGQRGRGQAVIVSLPFMPGWMAQK